MEDNKPLHPATHGHSRMLATAGGVIGQDFRGKVLSEYFQLNTREARASYARSWLKLIAVALKDTIPVLYDLALATREDGLYASSQYGDEEIFASFDQYWTARYGDVYRVLEGCERNNQLFGGFMSNGEARVSSEPPALKMLSTETGVAGLLGDSADDNPFRRLEELAQRRRDLIAQEDALRANKADVERQISELASSIQEKVRPFLSPVPAATPPSQPEPAAVRPPVKVVPEPVCESATHMFSPRVTKTTNNPESVRNRLLAALVNQPMTCAEACKLLGTPRVSIVTNTVHHLNGLVDYGGKGTKMTLTELGRKEVARVRGLAVRT